MRRLSLLPISIALLIFILSLLLFLYITSPYPILGALLTAYLIFELTYLIQFQQQKNQREGLGN